ncbi:DNA cytosine methyltransferase, partial [Acinetobacter baumannii]|nr:DNA cytosine methyltransferase [Acinetobacter baumannii]
MIDILNDQKQTYIDLFSGCGGLSLGLGKAGWNGLFAVEKDPMAFSTFKHNLIDTPCSHFNWPSWLPQKETTIQDLIDNYSEQLIKLKGNVDLIAGGPPCQGFSLAGLRNEKDPRNKLSEEYIK